MEIKKFKESWCDYFTECDHFPNIELGSYDCCCCKHNCGTEYDPEFIEEESQEKSCDYGKYFKIKTGIVKCDYKQ